MGQIYQKNGKIVCKCNPQMPRVFSFPRDLQKLCCFLNTGAVSYFQYNMPKNPHSLEQGHNLRVNAMTGQEPLLTVIRKAYKYRLVTCMLNVGLKCLSGRKSHFNQNGL